MHLIWTEDDGRVSRIHYQPENLTHEEAKSGISVDSVPEPREMEPWESSKLYYNESDGTFRYEYEDEFAEYSGNYTDEEKKQIHDMARSSSTGDVVDLLQQFTQ
jgi:hypothetical protein